MVMACARQSLLILQEEPARGRGRQEEITLTEVKVVAFKEALRKVTHLEKCTY